jgi:hypothetical protein
MFCLIRHAPRVFAALTCVVLFALPPGAQGEGGALLPTVPEAKARFSDTQGCVEPTEDMRKNHMDYILHQRDETMHEGIRTKRHSLTECINCHVVAGPDGEYPDIKSKEHFCNSCHSYAAVRVDCFQCHASHPVQIPPVDTLGLKRATGQDLQSLQVLAGEGMRDD